MENLEGHLFLHRYFMEWKDQFMPCHDYYVVRNGIAYHIHIASGEETDMGTPDIAFLYKSCKDLGAYSKDKVKGYDAKWISKDKLFKLLMQKGYIAK